MTALELWGGPECTISRTGDDFSDQLRLTKHHDRDDDIELICGLGLAAVRYPVLWERVSPNDPAKRDWVWSDKRLRRLRERNVRPIIGLVHHGSGPRYTNLLAENFAAGVERHAGAVAERYPWVQDWTPINEPCTTARFACLYGHWYPHHRDERSFWGALLNQIDATRLAMRAVRVVNPEARLIQTDDLGRTFATARVRDQAAFDNTRRWMGWDLLIGRVVPGHPFWTRICAHGFEQRIRAIADDPCVPDIIGINHYLTSDRFLDHRIHRYPTSLQGGNSDHPFVDTEAIRVLEPPPPGVDGVLREAWDRYGIPVAVTEAHNGSTREEQMRWTYDTWRTAEDLRREGVDVRAVTSWSLFGSSNWNTLLTAPGSYESGAYDVSSGQPRATAMVPLLRALATSVIPDHPVLAGAGWWERDIRLVHPPAPRPAPLREHRRSLRGTITVEPPPILIIGATDMIGRAIAAACAHRQIACQLVTKPGPDRVDAGKTAALLDEARPWAVINIANQVDIDPADRIRGKYTGAVSMVRACNERGIATVTFISDHIVNGTDSQRFHDMDISEPLGGQARGEASTERGITELGGRNLIIRATACFSPFDRRNFAARAIQTLRRGERFYAADHQVVSPTYVPDLANTVLDLAIDDEAGIWHLNNGTALSWMEFARLLAVACELDPDQIVPAAEPSLEWRVAFPAFGALDTAQARLLPSLQQAVAHFAHELRISGGLSPIAVAS
jgi:dTDP-4-dehydrorhamnose reductase